MVTASTRRSRAGWTVAGQGLSSISNFALSIAVAKTVGVTDFGAFSLAAAIYFVVIEVMRPLALEPLIVRHSATEPGQHRQARSGAVALATSFGLAAGLGTAAIGLFLADEVGVPLIIMGACLPVLFLQDACRYVFFSEGRMRAAALIDGLWLAVEVAGLVLLWLSGAITPATAIAVWGLSAACSAVVGLWWASMRPTLRGTWVWLRQHRDLSLRYVAEVLVETGAFQVSLFVVGLTAGLGALGALNGARVLLGPLSMLFAAVLTFTVSEGARSRAAAPGVADRLVRLAGLVLPALAMLWTAALLVLPDAFGQLLLGDTFAVAEPAILGLGIYWGAKGSINVARGGLRLAGLSRISLRIMILTAPLGIFGGVLGAIWAGAAGAAWGLGISSVLASLLWWKRLQRPRKGLSTTPMNMPESCEESA